MGSIPLINLLNQKQFDAIATGDYVKINGDKRLEKLLKNTNFKNCQFPKYFLFFNLR